MRKSGLSTILLAGIFAAVLISATTAFAEPNLVAHWKFDEGSGTTAYDSAGSNDGTITGATWTTGQIKGALEFNGLSDYVETSDDALLEFTQQDSFTISLWCKPSQTGFLVTKMQAGGASGNFIFRLQWSSTNSRFRFFIDKYGIGSTAVNTSNNSAPAGYWYHVVAVYDNKNMTIYLNGEPHENGTFAYDTGDTYPEENLLIGAQYYGSTLDGYFGGKIDDVQIYDKALSAEEIEQLYTQGHLIAHWKFDEGSGTTAYDSADGHNGTIAGNPAWVTGQVGAYALDFDGTGDYVNVGHNSSLDVDAFTISAWVYREQSGKSNQTIVDKSRLTSSYGGYALYTNADDTVNVYLADGAAPSPYFTTNNSFPASTWVHIAATFNGGTVSSGDVKVYFNAVEQTGTESNYGTSLKSNTRDVYIGTYDASTGTTGKWNGKIDDVRVYNRALSAGEVEQLYQEGLGGVNKAFAPNPTNGATGVDVDSVLSWSPGNLAASHDVYLGTNFNDVNNADTNSPEYKGNFDVNSFDPCGLELMTTYFWRIDEVNEPNIWKGNVWSFETERPEIGLSATEFEFTAIEDGANPADQILGVFNSGAGTLNWQISEDCGWLTALPASGNSTGEVDDVNLSVDISGLTGGTYICNLTVFDVNASNNPQIVTVTLVVLNAAPVMLNYDTEVYAEAIAGTRGGVDTETDEDFSSNGKAQAGADAYSFYWENCPPHIDGWSEEQWSSTRTSGEGIYDSNGAWLISTLKGWGSWVSDWTHCDGDYRSGSGRGSGNGHTSLDGEIAIGIPEGYAIGTGLTLRVEGEILGDVPGSWYSWQWHLKIWDDDPNNPLAVINDSNMTADVNVFAGQILNFEFYHEAEPLEWPGAGLDSTVKINLNLLYPLPADLDDDGDVDFADYAILASQWLDAPGEPSADIEPHGGDGIVDILDLGVLTDAWLLAGTI